MPSLPPHRNTRQRRAITEELCRQRSHPTAADLYQAIRHRLPRISLGTVYRNLELLARTGVVRKLEIPGGETRFDADTGRHYHVRCVRCGRVDDVRGLPREPVRGAPGELDGYEIVGYLLHFLGVCPACRGDAPSLGRRKENQ